MPVESNPSLGTRRLQQNEAWDIPSAGEDIFYRRDANPDHPDGRYTIWTHVPVHPRMSDKIEEIR
jgi:hypothetical protein